MNLEQKMMSSLEEVVGELVKEKATEKVLKKIRPVILDEIRSIYGGIPERHEIIKPDAEPITLKECVHEKFDDVLTIVSLGMPVYLSGKAGTGKNVICKQVAEALGLNFYFTNAVTQEYKLTGFIDANGVYQETQFYKAFTQGGLFFLDEMDASIPEVLIILNAALANGYFDFPTGKVDAHPDFRVIAAGNTIGGGADETYTGRYALDGASLDRFTKIDIDYSEKIEDALAGGDQELLIFAHAFRDACEYKRVSCLFTYRAIDRIHRLEKTKKFDMDTILDMALLKGLNKDDLRMVVDRMLSTPISGNRFLKALSKKANMLDEYKRKKEMVTPHK